MTHRTQTDAKRKK